jgi:hypothetical protein
VKPKKIRRPKKLHITTRNVSSNKGTIDEVKLVEISHKEMERLTDEPVELAFILPSVKLEAAVSQEQQFVRDARKRLGMWHRWLTSVFFGHRKKRNFFHVRVKRNGKRDVDDQKLVERNCLVCGVMLLNGEPHDFAQYERAFKLRQQETPPSQKKTRERSSRGAAITGLRVRWSGVFE